MKFIGAFIGILVGKWIVGPWIVEQVAYRFGPWSGGDNLERIILSANAAVRAYGASAWTFFLPLALGLFISFSYSGTVPGDDDQPILGGLLAMIGTLVTVLAMACWYGLRGA